MLIESDDSRLPLFVAMIRHLGLFLHLAEIIERMMRRDDVMLAAESIHL